MDFLCNDHYAFIDCWWCYRPSALERDREVYANHQHNKSFAWVPIGDMENAQVKGIKEAACN